MAEWLPPQLEAADGYEYMARLLVISTPDGFSTRWEDEEPSAAVRSEVAEFARRMSTEDFATAATPIYDLPPHLRKLIEQRSVAAAGDDESASADRVRPVPRDEEYGRVVFLRLKVRTAAAEARAVGSGERVIDFEFGPMGAPPEYPRVSINDVLRHAAATA
jgi:hypothetical protein